ncbi:MAG: NAD dependent epimerase/dehydratase family protein [Firmicutes bacterium ADurb.Bin300]|nr:MAG: NAD dependent epimerase/dehydratase family protein [Firmicutes bacterium ADurb.Bin300]HOD01806.1 NAD-dependent epimerase/dehydratase family protein [Clostridiales bacterium]
MKILVTGSSGFVGRNLVFALKNIAEQKDKSFNIDCNITVLEYDLGCEEVLFEQYCGEADFIVNLAGVNRPKEQDEFSRGNVDFVALLTEMLKRHKNYCPILHTSSIQAQLQNPYGESKRAGEEIIFSFGRETGAPVYVFRFPNIFGKWCRPNYNSVIATFCSNIASGRPITINDTSAVLKLVYIDDVVKVIIDAIKGQAHFDQNGKFCLISPEYEATLGEIADLLYSFKRTREDRSIPDLGNDFVLKLYATYTSYIPDKDLSYSLKMNADHRGSFTEFLKTDDRGQISINITKPGVTKGNHWHNTKNEKFCVVNGKAIIRLRKIGTDTVVEYHAGGDDMRVIDIPVGYTHSIKNQGDKDLVTIMWASELFNPDKPDTYYEEV